MRNTNLYSFIGLATTVGQSAAQAQKVFNFDYVTNDYNDLLNDPNIDLIAISTQHNTHAKFIVDALNAGKHVYCEKPMCLTLEELNKIVTTYNNSEGELFIGLNRRHAPLIKKIKNNLSTDKMPAVYDYISNAGLIPNNHWTQDEKIGGGRIIGEAIHFLDVLLFLDGSSIDHINVTFANNDAYTKKDNAVIKVKFKSGAIGSILYTSMGSKRYPKEELRVFTNGKVIEMLNYVQIKEYGTIKKSKSKLRQDKGFMDEYREMYFSLSDNKDNSMYINQVFEAHEKLLKALSQETKNG
jgi:predicted dehydrogenase